MFREANACDFFDTSVAPTNTPARNAVRIESLRNPHRTQWTFFGGATQNSNLNNLFVHRPTDYSPQESRCLTSWRKKTFEWLSLPFSVNIYSMCCNVKRMLIPRLLWFNRLSMAGSINSIRCGVVVMTATKRPVTCRTQVDHDLATSSRLQKPLDMSF